MFQEALTGTLSQLAKARICGLVHDYALIGGFALSAWGVPRVAQDIDCTCHGAVVPIVSWQALVLLKLCADGPQDRLDVEQILRARQPQDNDIQTVPAIAQLLGLLDEWTALVSRMS
ncbi:MAG: hypothetical protein H8K10_20720 [Nitrospira sp.]|nr:hypothetical protein [Nitrospira sp.]